MNKNYRCGCDNELDLDKLCAKKIKACEICADKIRVDDFLCTKSLEAEFACMDDLIANKLDSQNICVDKLGAHSACIQDLNAAKGSVQSLTVNDLCVAGRFNASNFLNCSKYRAASTYGQNVVYTLGSDVNFNTILDDPNSNLQSAPTRYNVPVSGYYVATFKFNVANLVVAGEPILGAPIGNPQLFVNGSVFWDMYTSWLTFANGQKQILSALMMLEAGDIVTLKYNILALDSVLGIINVVGTVDVAGNGANGPNSNFEISLLNADCDDMLPCEPSLPCEPCTPRECNPCEPEPDECDDRLKAPHLNPIHADPQGSNNYLVSWSPVKHALNYTLEQDSNSAFNNPVIVAYGNILSKQFLNQANGTYYYRVFASYPKDNSPYSNIESIVINLPLAAPLSAKPSMDIEKPKPAASSSRRSIF